jgi:hypothetical protein
MEPGERDSGVISRKGGGQNLTNIIPGLIDKANALSDAFAGHRYGAPWSYAPITQHSAFPGLFTNPSTSRGAYRAAPSHDPVDQVALPAGDLTAWPKGGAPGIGGQGTEAAALDTVAARSSRRGSATLSVEAGGKVMQMARKYGLVGAPVVFGSGRRGKKVKRGGVGGTGLVGVIKTGVRKVGGRVIKGKTNEDNCPCTGGGGGGIGPLAPNPSLTALRLLAMRSRARPDASAYAAVTSGIVPAIPNPSGKQVWKKQWRRGAGVKAPLPFIPS